tara:strand:+ start:4475 stop:5005 length:531 start_codon:yes stop_codon:yes gene_type:complete
MAKKVGINKTAKSKKQNTKKARVPKSDSQLKNLKEDLALEKEKYLRLFAEFENFKKRTAKERLDLFKTANQEVIISLIPVLDDFKRAVLQIENDINGFDKKGVELIYNKFNDSLKSNGLEETKIEVGDVFNPDLHEAISQIKATNENQKGKIIDVIELGYKLGEKIIRYPKVVVGQ